MSIACYKKNMKRLLIQLLLGNKKRAEATWKEYDNQLYSYTKEKWKCKAENRWAKSECSFVLRSGTMVVFSRRIRYIQVCYATNDLNGEKFFNRRCMLKQLKTILPAHRWLWGAGVLLFLFVVFTALVVSGVLIYPTLYTEQWLLQRPLTGFDCVLSQWGNVGNATPTLVIVVLLAGVCLLLRYRPRVAFSICLLFLIGIGAEYLGKQYLAQPLPDRLSLGLGSLSCPQLWRAPHSARLMLYLGMWWKAPVIAQWRVANAYTAAITPFSLVDADSHFGYPSGHAIRWCYIGLLSCWLAWRHVRAFVPRLLLMAVALIVAFGGGFAHFFIGYHLATDLIAGYLLGTALACLAIASLIWSERVKAPAIAQAASPPPEDDVALEEGKAEPVPEKSP